MRMRRDMDLIRLLLLKYEGEDPPELTNYTEAQQLYHTCLLIQAGLLDGEPVRGGKGDWVSAHVFGLTWEGHEFIDLARNNTVWKKAMSTFRNAALPVCLEILKS